LIKILDCFAPKDFTSIYTLITSFPADCKLMFYINAHKKQITEMMVKFSILLPEFMKELPRPFTKESSGDFSQVDLDDLAFSFTEIGLSIGK
jgi:hypothetical protein